MADLTPCDRDLRGDGVLVGVVGFELTSLTRALARLSTRDSARCSRRLLGRLVALARVSARLGLVMRGLSRTPGFFSVPRFGEARSEWVGEGVIDRLRLLEGLLPLDGLLARPSEGVLLPLPGGVL